VRQFILLTLVSAGLFADIRIPPPIEKNARMRIVHDDIGKYGPVLDIPASLLSADTKADIRPPFPVPPGGGGWADAISGVFLTIAAFFAGRMFWRRGRGPTKVLIPAILAAGGALLWIETSHAQNVPTIADAAPDGELAEPVKVRILRSGNQIILHLPPLGKR